MKILKLSGILLALIASIIGVIAISNLIDNKELSPETITDEINISQTCNDFTKQWEETPIWNKKLHEEQRNKVLLWSNNKMLSMQGHETLINNIYENSINKVYNGYYAALRKKPFNHKNLMAAYSHVGGIKNVETTAQNDTRIKKITQLHNYYNNVNSFANSSHQLTANLSANFTWTPFNELKNAKLAAARAYRTNPLYNEVKHIATIVKGLSDNEVARKVENHRDAFYASLTQRIITYFKTSTISEANKDLLKSIKTGAFQNEAPEKYRRELNRYFIDYEDQLHDSKVY